MVGSPKHCNELKNTCKASTPQEAQCLQNYQTRAVASVEQVDGSTKKVSSEIHVSCCDDDGNGSRPEEEKPAKWNAKKKGEWDGCVKHAPFHAAAAHCQKKGLRLCTRQEITGDGTDKNPGHYKLGCKADFRMVWTSEPCKPPIKALQVPVTLNAITCTNDDGTACTEDQLRENIAALYGVPVEAVVLKNVEAADERRRRRLAEDVAVDYGDYGYYYDYDYAGDDDVREGYAEDAADDYPDLSFDVAAEAAGLDDQYSHRVELAGLEFVAWWTLVDADGNAVRRRRRAADASPAFHLIKMALFAHTKAKGWAGVGFASSDGGDDAPGFAVVGARGDGTVAEHNLSDQSWAEGTMTPTSPAAVANGAVDKPHDDYAVVKFERELAPAGGTNAPYAIDPAGEPVVRMLWALGAEGAKGNVAHKGSALVDLVAGTEVLPSEGALDVEVEIDFGLGVDPEAGDIVPDVDDVLERVRNPDQDALADTGLDIPDGAVEAEPPVQDECRVAADKLDGCPCDVTAVDDECEAPSTCLGGTCTAPEVDDAPEEEEEEPKFIGDECESGDECDSGACADGVCQCGDDMDCYTGLCVNNRCECDAGYFGVDCSAPVVSGCTDPTACNYRGECRAAIADGTGERPCTPDQSWWLPNCVCFTGELNRELGNGAANTDDGSCKPATGSGDSARCEDYGCVVDADGDGVCDGEDDDVAIACTTVGGAGPGGVADAPAPGTACHFPFIFNGQTHNSCTAAENGGVPWCATGSATAPSAAQGVAINCDGAAGSTSPCSWGNCNCCLTCPAEAPTCDDDCTRCRVTPQLCRQCPTAVCDEYASGSASPSASPSAALSAAPSARPTASPSVVPSAAPSASPRASPATCSDSIKNGQETAADCGGGDCSPCGAGQGCLIGADCDSGSCAPTTKRCAAPTKEPTKAPTAATVVDDDPGSGGGDDDGDEDADPCADKACGDLCGTSGGTFQTYYYCQPDGACGSDPSPDCGDAAEERVVTTKAPTTAQPSASPTTSPSPGKTARPTDATWRTQSMQFRAVIQLNELGAAVQPLPAATGGQTDAGADADDTYRTPCGGGAASAGKSNVMQWPQGCASGYECPHGVCFKSSLDFDAAVEHAFFAALHKHLLGELCGGPACLKDLGFAAAVVKQLDVKARRPPSTTDGGNGRRLRRGAEEGDSPAAPDRRELAHVRKANALVVHLKLTPVEVLRNT